MQILLFMVGIGLLVGGAWLLILGGSRIAAVLKVPPVVVGLTVVAFGTSAPELFVSVVGAIKGSTGLVLGNVIGSNVANLGLILGLAAALRPVAFEREMTRREIPLMLAASVAFAALAWDGTVGRMDAILLFGGFLGFMAWTISNKDRGSIITPAPDNLPETDPDHRLRELSKGFGLVVAGVGGLAGGGHLIVSTAIVLAGNLGVSETMIGLTMVAVGTSLPELATTVMAALRNEDDLALGNIVGSNLFNILAVAGPVGIFRELKAEGSLAPVAGLPLGPTSIQAQLVGMLFLTFMVYLMIMVGRGRIGRRRGLILLLTYGGIMAFYSAAN